MLIFNDVNNCQGQYLVIDAHNRTWPCETSDDAQAIMESMRQEGIKSICVMICGRS